MTQRGLALSLEKHSFRNPSHHNKSSPPLRKSLSLRRAKTLLQVGDRCVFVSVAKGFMIGKVCVEVDGKRCFGERQAVIVWSSRTSVPCFSIKQPSFAVVQLVGGTP